MVYYLIVIFILIRVFREKIFRRLHLILKEFFVSKNHGQVWLAQYTVIKRDTWRLILNLFLVKIFIKKYFLIFLVFLLSYNSGYYFTGDGAFKDKDGHLQITGRVDDVINVSGHRIGTAEIEDALVLISI